MSANDQPIITRRVANYVLHYFHSDEGYSGGSYFDCLFRLAALADKDHLQKLANEYPVEMRAFELVRNNVEGLNMLRTIAKMLVLVGE